MNLAVTPQSNEAFLREVDEELRRDQALQLWRRYGRWAIGVGVAGLAAFGGYLLWISQQQSAAGAESQKLSAVLESLDHGDVPAAGKALTEITGSSRAGYRTAARFLQGDIALSTNDLGKAAARFGEVANDPSAPASLRELALIRQTTAEFDKLAPQTVVTRLKPLTDKGSPWLGAAGELVATAYLEMNRPAEAGKLFAAIAQDETAPQTLRARAVQMAGTLGVEATPAIQGLSK